MVEQYMFKWCVTFSPLCIFFCAYVPIAIQQSTALLLTHCAMEKAQSMHALLSKYCKIVHLQFNLFTFF